MCPSSPMTRCSHEHSPFQLLHGEPHIFEDVLDLRFRISPDAFFQVNTSGAEVLYRVVRELSQAAGDTVLLDVCCGTGEQHEPYSSWVGRDLKAHPIPPVPWAGCPPPSQAAQGPIQPSYRHPQGWGTAAPWGWCFACPTLSPMLVFSTWKCGVFVYPWFPGTIGLSLARHVSKVIGVEIVQKAIEDARWNAAFNGKFNHCHC